MSPDPRSVAKRGDNNPEAKLTEIQVANILRIGQQEGLKYGWKSRLARKYKVSPQLINDIEKGRKWKYLRMQMTQRGILQP